MLKYPVYIPSKGRSYSFLTGKLFARDGLPYKVFVESREVELYVDTCGRDAVVDLGGNDFGDVAYARNFIKRYAVERGAKRHWQIDDDVAGFMQVANRKTLSENTEQILSAAEFFVDQYKNISMAGFSSSVFGKLATKPYAVNRFAYTCFLLDSASPFKFTSASEEDLDYNLQVLTSGLCTVQFNMFLFKWSTTGTRAGGYTELNRDGRRETRQRNTLARWPKLLPQTLAAKGDDKRIVTNGVWKNFKQELIKR